MVSILLYYRIQAVPIAGDQAFVPAVTCSESAQREHRYPCGDDGCFDKDDSVGGVMIGSNNFGLLPKLFQSCSFILGSNYLISLANFDVEIWSVEIWKMSFNFWNFNANFDHSRLSVLKIFLVFFCKTVDFIIEERDLQPLLNVYVPTFVSLSPVTSVPLLIPRISDLRLFLG